jgi:hypothetical protein
VGMIAGSGNRNNLEFAKPDVWFEDTREVGI